MANISTRTPGRPSGVSRGIELAVDAGLAPQPMTDVAKPVIVTAACLAQRRFGPVMMSAVPCMAKASAKLSSMRDAIC